jgi:hypothetical protein
MPTKKIKELLENKKGDEPMKKFSVLGIILALCCLFVGSVVAAREKGSHLES